MTCTKRGLAGWFVECVCGQTNAIEVAVGEKPSAAGNRRPAALPAGFGEGVESGSFGRGNLADGGLFLVFGHGGTPEKQYSVVKMSLEKKRKRKETREDKLQERGAGERSKR
jgi:hypothetical protein